MVWRQQRILGWGTLLFLIALPVLAWPGDTFAGTYPRKAIQLVVSFSPGGGSDVVARVVAKYLAAELGVPVNVVNKEGGNQIPAILSVLNAAPDGYTLLQEQQANSAIKATLQDLPFKLEDRTYGPLTVGGPNAFVVSGKSPWKTLKDVVEAARRDPGAFTWVRTGGSSFTDMVTLQLFDIARIDASKTKPVDFPGVGPGNTAVAGGHVMLGGGGAGSVVAMVNSGDLRAVAVTGDRRLPALPDAPSAKESGFPESSLMNWYGISGPKGLPKEVLDRLDAAAKKLAQNPEFIKDLEKIASYPIYTPPPETREHVLKEAELYKRLAAKFGK
ncbi:MAG TPA: tripartite tricarboxylate transporter substrate binding protein [Candidatus Methylomirabilis sp.]|nr:tripartite tricarboxylate transporter substrate binding protein [Candidatus Methylomirabilis sp.]